MNGAWEILMMSMRNITGRILVAATWGLAVAVLGFAGTANATILLSEDFEIGAGSNFDDITTHGWTKNSGNAAQLQPTTIDVGDSVRFNGASSYEKALSLSVPALGSGEYLELTFAWKKIGAANHRRWFQMTMGDADSEYGLRVDLENVGVPETELFTFIGTGFDPWDGFVSTQNFLDDLLVRMRAKVTATAVTWSYQREGVDAGWVDLITAAGTFGGVTKAFISGDDFASATDGFADSLSVVASIATQWDVDASGLLLWSTAGNWSPATVPNSNSSVANFGNVITAPRTVTNNGTVTVQEMRFDNANKYTIAGTGSVTLDGDGTSPLVTVNQGSHDITVGVNLSDNANVNVDPGASLNFNNVLNLNGNTLTKTLAGTMNLNGTVNTGGGSVVVAAGVAGGTGTVSGDLTNTGGTVSPGLSPGTLNVTGVYNQASGSLLIEIDGLTPDTQHDVLNVTGDLIISGGSLDVVLGFAPTFGNTFDILNFATADLSGMTLNLPNLGSGLTWDSSQLAIDGTLSLANLGDFNGDGSVNTDDYDIMRANWLTGASPGLNELGEVTGDGLVNLDDFSLFKETLFGGLASALASAVPEPNSLVLLLAVVPAWLVRRSRRKMA